MTTFATTVPGIEIAFSSESLPALDAGTGSREANASKKLESKQ